MRSSAQVYIYLDMEKALQGLISNCHYLLKSFNLLDGFKFFLSTNNVILSPGDDNGFIPSRYFRSVEDRQGKQIPLPINSLKTKSSEN
jgi:2'-phosphotransferase